MTLGLTQTQVDIRKELRQAVFDCRERGLYEAAAWAAQQLTALPEETLPLKPGEVRPGGEQESDVYLLAKSHFDCKEYQRCAHALRNETSVPKACFLRFYSEYLAGERRRHEEKIEMAGALGKVDVQNRMLDDLERDLEEMHKQNQLDAFCMYVYGLVLADRSKTEAARAVLAESVKKYPCNWSAWKALQQVCHEWEETLELNLTEHVMRDFFNAVMCLDLHWCNEALSRMDKLSEVFPRSRFLILKAACAHYSSRKMDEAQELFEDLYHHDNYDLQGMDTYSNILYMKEDFAKLSHLAHNAVLVDKYRPETCCVIGNYYSLKSLHDKAVLYFQRALNLDPNCLEAWTLIGHEYLEMKNPNAAIEAYRRAVDVNAKDFRAWYGLGQTYEMLVMPYYALFYYRKAAQLRPNDARMWVAMGQCYSHDHLKLYDAAAKCYRRAVTSGDHENIVLHKLAELYKLMNQHEAAFSCYKQNLEHIDQQNSTGQDAVDALTFMAEFCLRKRRFPDAETYAMRLQDFGGPAKDKGRKVIDEIQKLKAEQRPDGLHAC
eukprot:jgi/Ulvmu1/9798/UM056_0038.1